MAKAADCKSATVGSNPTGASKNKTPELVINRFRGFFVLGMLAFGSGRALELQGGWRLSFSERAMMNKFRGGEGHGNHGNNESHGNNRGQNSKRSSERILKPRGDYRTLLSFQKAEVVYDVTFRFSQKYLSRGDRTVDQMIQSARSCKQNILEGGNAGTTSKETEIQLTNVARASLEELLADYHDFLRVRDLRLWSKDCKGVRIARRRCSFVNWDDNRHNILKSIEAL